MLKKIESDGANWPADGDEYKGWVSELNGVLRIIPDNESRLKQVENIATFSSVTVVHRFGAPSGPKVSQEDHASRIRDLIAITKELLTELKLRVKILDSEKGKPQLEPPSIFIAHGGKSAVRDKVEAFVEALGCKAIIVEDQSGTHFSTGSKVENYLHKADFAVVVATVDRGSEQDGKIMPRGNVIEEMGRIQESHPKRRILLLEEGLKLPSNDSNWIWAAFTTNSLDDALIKIARELSSIGLVQATKV